MSTVPPDDELQPPRPLITPASRPFWDALAEHRVELQRCQTCRSWVHYPRLHCPACGSTRLTFEPTSGAGRIHSFTVARQPTVPHFARDVPQIIAIVELECGARLTSTIVTDEPAALRIGTRVVPAFDDGDDGITLLRFRPA